MPVADSIRQVPTPKPPREGKPTTRQAVADVVDYLIGGLAMKKNEFIAQARNISESSFFRITRGDPTVSDQKLWSLAKALGVPTATFTLMVAGDVEGIEALVALDPDTKQYILNVLSGSELPRGRRSSDG